MSEIWRFIASTPWLDYTVSGVVLGSIYALLAVGLAMIKGIANLINFAHGAIFTVGAYVGWTCIVWLGLPLPLTLVGVVLVTALLGIAIERIGLRPLRNSSQIAPLLATIGIGLILDQAVHLIFSPNPRALPSQLPDWRFTIGAGTIGTLDLVIAAVGIVSAGLLYVFLRFTKLGWAARATAQDRDAAQQMGVDINLVNMSVFAIASALGGIAGLLVGMYYNSIDPNASFQAMLKGMVALVIGGMGNIPGAIGGGLILGLIESYGIALFGSSYRNLFAFVMLILMLVWRPNGVFMSGRELPPEPMTGTFMARSQPVRLHPLLLAGVLALAALLPLLGEAYLTQVMTNALLYAILALSLTLVAGTVGLVSIGQAALFAIGAYASALLAKNWGLPLALSILCAGAITAAIATLLIYPAFRLRGLYVSIATLAIGEIVSLLILNWAWLTEGPMGLVAIPPLEFFGVAFYSVERSYWLALGAVTLLALMQSRLLASHLGRTWRSIREDDVAAQTYGVSANRYKALAFVVAGFIGGIGGAISAHLFTYINHETFNWQTSLIALTIVIAGGMGNVAGAILASVIVVGLPELFRVAADFRVLFYGLALLLLVRFRPQGILGTA